MNLNVKSNVSDGVGLVSVSGEVDVSNADVLREEIKKLLADESLAGISVDLGEVPYIDSTGIGVLVGAAHRATEEGRQLVATNVQPNVARIFGMLGVDEILG